MANLEDAAHFLRGADKILILSHRSPDGDTLGCASALSRALIALGKSVMFRCADPVPPKFTYLFEGIEYGEFEPEHIVTVDVADKTLLGSLEPYGDKTGFCHRPPRVLPSVCQRNVGRRHCRRGMRAHRAFDSGARRGDHAEGRGLSLYGHFHRYGLLPLPERIRKHVPHRGRTFWSTVRTPRRSTA